MAMTDEIRNQILSCPSLPSLPTIAVQVLELAQKEEVDLNQIAKTITQDPALAGKLLKTVNSSFYGRSNAVATVSHALVIMGIQSVKTLVLGFSLVTTLTSEKNAKGSGFDHMRYWRRSIYAATATRLIATKVGFVQQEEAFLATLLADIGALVLSKVFGADYDAVCKRAAASHDLLATAEASALGVDHASAGALLAEQWKLPPLLVTPIAHHPAPEQIPASPDQAALVKLTQLVALGGRCADVYVDAEPANAIVEVRGKLKDQFGMSEADADALLSELGSKTREAAQLFEINIGSAIDFAAVLKRANDALVELTLQSQLRATQLAEQNEQLKVKATTDRLTGLANRATFDEFLAEAFAKAVDGGEPLSLIMLDVDKFKSINDKHGHPTGDAVLKHLGALLKQLARDNDLAARYGGEEMALILPGTPRAMAATVAETVRRAIAARAVTHEAVSLSITASLGVATLEVGSPFRQPAHLIKAADLAVYKAKHAGRNNVKVFSLPPAAPGANVKAA